MLLRHGETGWLVPPADPAALAEGLRRTLLNPRAARLRAQQARCEYYHYHTAARMVRGYEQLFAECISGKRPGTVSSSQGAAAVEQPGVGEMRIAGSPFHMSATPGTVRTPAPRLGEHSVDVLRSVLGYSDETIENLRKQKAIYTHEDLRRKT